MNELKSNLKHKKPNPVKDAAGLSSLIGFLNDPRVTGAVVPKGENPGAVAITETPTVKPTPPPVSPPATAPVQSPAPVANITKVAFTGRLMSGKDRCAEQGGLKVFSFAEPLYRMQFAFFGNANKTLPGARAFLQAAGQIGRGEISATYPLSLERACFISLVQQWAARVTNDDSGVDWSLFGTYSDIWLDALLRRVEVYLKANPGSRVAATNVRFQNEYTKLTSAGFVPFHVMCSPATWAERLKAAGMTPESPALKDVSEQLAAGLDQSVTKQLSAQRQGAKLRCVWSDGKVACPSSRLLTVSDFVALFPK